MTDDNELYHYLRINPFGYFLGIFHTSPHGDLVPQATGDEGRAQLYTRQGAHRMASILESLGYITQVYGDP